MSELPVLDPAEQRVLGALLEKQVTVPASYPLSLNALQTACNQATSREPVTDYPVREVEEIARRLKDRRLLRSVWAGGGARVLRFHQLLDEVLDLQVDEKALITLLLLRGEQAPGELKTRSERLHPFRSREEVEECLAGLAARELPLVRELPLQAGQHDRRWVHLLGPIPGAHAEVPDPAVDRDAVIADGAGARDARVRAAYDAAAVGYARAYADELQDKPFDRWLLGQIADRTAGPIADVGCGPGQTTALLAGLGADVTGLDLSPGIIAQARELHPEIGFDVGDFSRMLRPPRAPAWGAITAWYAFVHLSGSELAPVIAGLARVLAPGGTLAFCVHTGNEVRHAAELCGADVDVDFVLHDRDQVLAATAAAGLSDIEWYLRSPLPVEVATERLYVVASQATARR
ncbi:MAG: DUF480 domain-containing protein [Tetrasphaera sp.]